MLFSIKLESAVIGAAIHPVPFRTWKLRPPANGRVLFWRTGNPVTAALFLILDFHKD